LWTIASPPTPQNWKTKTPCLAQQAILSRCVLVRACWGTHWEHVGNPLGTHCEQQKYQFF
jgi:hypothetical protein